MARLARVVALDTPHHITQRGNGRQYILESDTDRLVYLDLLRKHCRLHRLSLLGYCLMSNHVHRRFAAPRAQAHPWPLRRLLQRPLRLFGSRLAGAVLLLPARPAALVGGLTLHGAEPCYEAHRTESNYSSNDHPNGRVLYFADRVFDRLQRRIDSIGRNQSLEAAGKLIESP